MKKETLEEAAEKYSKRSSASVFQEAHKRDFIEGAKWQAEQLFKDEAIQTLEKAAQKHAENKSSAVEWLIEKLDNNLDIKHSWRTKQYIDQAKEMEKQQAERMYSEEDFKLFARQYYREIKLDKSNLLWDVLADKCFEQFKKK